MQNFPIELFALSFISERYNFPIFVWLVIFCFCWLLMNTWFFSCLQNLSDLHFLLINIHKKKKNILISVCTITLLNRQVFWGVRNSGLGAVTHWKNFLWKIIHMYIGVVSHQRFFQKGVTKKNFFFFVTTFT